MRRVERPASDVPQATLETVQLRAKIGGADGRVAGWWGRCGLTPVYGFPPCYPAFRPPGFGDLKANSMQRIR